MEAPKGWTERGWRDIAVRDGGGTIGSSAQPLHLPGDGTIFSAADGEPFSAECLLVVFE